MWDGSVTKLIRGSVVEGNGVNVVMGTVWYREEVYSKGVYQKSTNELADLLSVRFSTESAEPIFGRG